MASGRVMKIKNNTIITGNFAKHVRYLISILMEMS